MRQPKGTPTSLNLWTLAKVFGSLSEIPNKLEATRVAGIRRCLAAGLVAISPDKKTLLLTEAGKATLEARAKKIS